MAHILVFPYPSASHMMPLLELTHKLATRGLTITILVPPQNLPLLDPILSKHPNSIQTLVLPFPSHPSHSVGLESAKGQPPNAVRVVMRATTDLHHPILQWFQNHRSPPVAILSDKFLGWTHNLACQLNIKRFAFSPVSAIAVSLVYSVWRDLPKRDDPNDHNCPISFPKIPNFQVYPWWQLSAFYRSYVERDPDSEIVKDAIYGDIASYGLVINTSHELEMDYLDHLKEVLGHNRVWAVGPLLSPDEDKADPGPTKGDGSKTGSARDVLSWLDTCDDHTVVYVCFGSKTVLKNEQIEGLALGLEKSGAHFIWCVNEPKKGHVEGGYCAVPSGFEDRVAGKGFIIRGWAAQRSILSHRAVGAFLTHCGWISTLEGLVSGVPLLAWPMAAEQFFNAKLLVDELKVAIIVCEGAQTIPDSAVLARAVAELVGENRVERARAVELSKAIVDTIKEGGTSFKDVDELVMHISN
ncbi:UDP-glycosyltransferase 89B2-like [Cornus florida]|uniref:UDP-glycosyltransferase 89B2-like n=1 Tax=Cornus florida TaxID=4283 RepID=UPI0028A2A2EE|nr:UDP-glycosyltransferase 89B2-like [Cornus florida]